MDLKLCDEITVDLKKITLDLKNTMDLKMTSRFIVLS